MMFTGFVSVNRNVYVLLNDAIEEDFNVGAVAHGVSENDPDRRTKSTRHDSEDNKDNNNTRPNN